jgi:hypothetical protein
MNLPCRYTSPEITAGSRTADCGIPAAGPAACARWGITEITSPIPRTGISADLLPQSRPDTGRREGRIRATHPKSQAFVPTSVPPNGAAAPFGAPTSARRACPQARYQRARATVICSRERSGGARPRRTIRPAPSRSPWPRGSCGTPRRSGHRRRRRGRADAPSRSRRWSRW